MNDNDIPGTTLNSIPDPNLYQGRDALQNMQMTMNLRRNFNTPIMPWQANSNAPQLPAYDPGKPLFPDVSNLKPAAEWGPYNPGGGPPAETPAALQDILNGHLQRMSQLTANLARTSSSEAADVYRRAIANTSDDIQNVRARLNAAGPKLMPPSLVGHPGSGGILNEERFLQQQRENLVPPHQND